MDGQGICAAALADAGLRRLASELDGPRPAATVPATTMRASARERVSEAAADSRTAIARRPWKG